MPDGRIPTRLTDLWCAHEEIKCSLYIKQWIKGQRSGECIFWVQTVKTPHFHHKTKIKFIFLAELVIFILVKNVQLFYFFCKLHIFCHKVLHFIFRTIISVIFLIKKKIECTLTICKYSCNCYHFRWLWRMYRTFTTRDRSKNQLVIFSLLNKSVETCTTSGLNWRWNCRLWGILLNMATVVANQNVNKYPKRTSSSQVDWKMLKGHNMYLK